MKMRRMLMRLVELLFLLSLIFTSSFFLNKNIVRISNLSKSVENKKSSVINNEFIYKSFINTCKGEMCGSKKGFSSLNEWQVSCRAMFDLDYISWGNADEFMVVNSEKEKLLYGKWFGKSINGEIYCRK
jgi:hypothetical protein